jgi:transposase
LCDQLKKGTRPVSDRISLRLGRRDMNTFATIDRPGRRPVVHVAGRHAAALCPACARPSVMTNGTGWRDVIDVVRTLVITLSICVRRFICEHDDCTQRSFDERFEGIGRSGASERALGFFADLARGRATAAVARDLGVPGHYLRVAVGQRRCRAQRARRLGRHLAIDECSIAKHYVFATVFSDPDRGVVLDVGPGRDGAVVWAFADQYSHAERAAVQVVTMDFHAPYRHFTRVWFPNAVIVADAFHLHARVLEALARVRRTSWRRIRRRELGDVGEVPKRRSVNVGGLFFGASHALARARDDLDADTSARGERQRGIRDAACMADTDLAVAYELKEAFRAAMGIGRAGDVAVFTVAVDIFVAWCRDSGLKPFATVARTFRSWRDEILAYAATGGASNAFAEAIIHQIKNQKRQAHGYGSWHGFRGQVLWVFGEAVHPETGEIKPLRLIPRGEGAQWHQP